MPFKQGSERILQAQVNSASEFRYVMESSPIIPGLHMGLGMFQSNAHLMEIPTQTEVVKSKIICLILCSKTRV